MIQLAGIVVGAALAAGGLVVPASATDQASADAAVDAFTQRMTDAGFVAEAADDDDDEDDDDEAPESSTDGDEGTDDSFDDCFAESGIPVPEDPEDELPGATAEAESPEMVFAPEGETAPTEMFDFSAAIPESIAVMVTTVDESSTELMTQLVTWMGSKDAAACFEQSIADDMLSPDDDDAGDDMDIDIPPPEIEMSNSADIGVGDVSARIDMSFSMVFIVEIELDMTLLMAQNDRSMVMLTYVTGADGPVSGVDPIAELQAVVGDLAA